MSARTRSTARPRRVEVERMSAPQAEMSTAGVIIAVRTATAEVKASICLYRYGAKRRGADYGRARRARANARRRGAAAACARVRTYTRAAERVSLHVSARGRWEEFLCARLKVVVRANQSCV